MTNCLLSFRIGHKINPLLIIAFTAFQEFFMLHKCYKLSVLFVLLTGCTSQAWYEGAQQHHKLECLNNPTTRMETCQQTGQRYDTYKREVENVR
jgi:hypothetical protein